MRMMKRGGRREGWTCASRPGHMSNMTNSMEEVDGGGGGGDGNTDDEEGDEE
jgi:hypothetical protein